MKCDEAREIMADYWDYPDGDRNRVRVDEHIRNCPNCAEQFEIWRESAILIQSVGIEPIWNRTERSSVSDSVMERIYSDERWRLPVAERLYSIPHKLRIRLLTLISGCMALFFCAFLYQLMFPGGESRPIPDSGVITVSALGGGETSEFLFAGIEGVPVASIGDPVVLGLPLVDSYPDYLLVLSMLGLIYALLTLNWFARIRM